MIAFNTRKFDVGFKCIVCKISKVCACNSYRLANWGQLIYKIFEHNYCRFASFVIEF